jgi:hypothetical protein
MWNLHGQEAAQSCYNQDAKYAGVAELADAADSKWVLHTLASSRTKPHRSEKLSVHAGSVNVSPLHDCA